ncbi:MAG: autotransporter domain-containing protein [Bosea sp. (in: a-proteobacteria)]
MTLKISTLAALTAALVTSSAIVSSEAVAQSRYVAFGDSLSDSGNFFVATGQPPAPYFQGRFTNGLTWVEQLAGPMRGFFPVGAVDNTRSTNFAFGGARTDGGPGSPTAPNISGGTGAQITNYLARGGRFGANDIATLWAGANNIIQALPGAGGNPATAQAVMTGVVTAAANDVGNNLRALAGAGARTIVSINLPSFAGVPAYSVGPGAPLNGLAGLSAGTFNAILAGQQAAVAAANPGTNLISVDVAGLFNAIQATPSAFGFANASTACTAVLSCALGSKAVQNSYAFWDDVHPTEAGHTLVAAAVNQYLNAPIYAASFAPYGEVAIQGRRDAMLRGFDRLESARDMKPGVNQYYVALTGNSSSANARNREMGYDSRGGGVAFGIDRAFDNAWSMTAGGSVSVGNFKARPVEGSVLQFGFDATAQYVTGAFYAKAGAGLGVTRFGDVERDTVGPLFNRSSANAVSGNLGTEIGLRYQLGAITVSPRARLNWISAQVQSFSESGIIAPLAVDGRSVNALAAAGELRISADIISDPARKTTAYGTIGYERNLAYSGNSVSARLINNTALPFTVSLADPKGAGLVVGGGINGRISQMISVGIDYKATIGERSAVRHTGQASLNLTF